MNQNLQTVLTSLLLAMIVVGLLSYSEWERWFETDNIASVEEAQPDLIAHAIQQRRFDDKGELQYEMVADEMLQFLDADVNHIVKPDIMFYHEKSAAWKTTANEGRSDALGEELHLQGNVMVEQQNSAHIATMETTSLVLYPKLSRASTEDRVIIRQQGIVIRALGLDADLNTNKLNLKSQVNSIYEPAKS